MKIFPWVRLYFLEALFLRPGSGAVARAEIESKWQSAGLTKEFEVDGGSMGYSLPAGSRVVVHFSEDPSLERNCLLYIRQGSIRVVHRYLGRLGPLILEQGDNNAYVGLHLKSSVLGVVDVLSIASPVEVDR